MFQRLLHGRYYDRIVHPHNLYLCQRVLQYCLLWALQGADMKCEAALLAEPQQRQEEQQQQRREKEEQQEPAVRRYEVSSATKAQQQHEQLQQQQEEKEEACVRCQELLAPDVQQQQQQLQQQVNLLPVCLHYVSGRQIADVARHHVMCSCYVSFQHCSSSVIIAVRVKAG